ncbi:MAG: tetratricopeptide repeat protein, partial [Acidobacteriota bacterium]|nr:tetratricopeptide repeat protein [Acidobacteriota bacterium]
VHDRAQAIAEYRQVLTMQPQLPSVHYELARLLSDTAIEEAVQLLKAELRIDPQHYLAKGLLGRIYVATHQADAAIPLLTDALAAKPDLLEPRKALGQAWAEKKEFAKVLECYRAVEERYPSDEQIHFLLAQAYTALGKPDDAARERELHQAVLRQAATRR